MKLNMLMPGQKLIMRETAEPGSSGGEPPAGDPPADVTPEPTLDLGAFVPEAFKGEDGAYDTAKFREDYDGLTALKAQHDERLATVPETADAYEFAFPEEMDFGDLDLPEGFTVESMAEDENFKPLFGAFGEFLHKHQVGGEAAKDAMALIGKYEATKFSQNYAKGKAEIESLERGKERIATVQRSLETRLPEGMATALMGAVGTADGVRALEKLLSGPGPKSPTPQPAATVDENASPTERLKSLYADEA